VLGHNNQPISATGRRRAKRLYRYLKDKSVSSIFVSDYVRTVQTITYAADRLHLTPVVDSLLNEIDVGEIETLNDGEIRARYPELWEAYTNRSADFRFPGGETGTEAQHRVGSFLSDIRTTGGAVVAVSHDGLVRSLLCAVLEIPVYKRFDFTIDLCGFMEIEYDENVARWRLIRFNHVV
jgi:broad specificity phosphatase PhoE